FLPLYPAHPDLPSFPTRRSSDLEGGFFVNLFLADAETGRVKRRLVKSTQNNNYESLRFINSAGSFSPDGRYFALAAKRKDRDDRSEEHTSELQSLRHLVCRLLLE